MASKANPFSIHRLRFVAGIYGLLAVPMGMLFVFVYLPFAWAFVSSLFEFEIGAKSTFVGLSNYKEFLFDDPVTWVAFGNMFLLTAFLVCIRLTVPLVVAKVIHSLNHERWRHAYRIVFLIPIVVPMVAIQLIWRSMIYYESGLLNQLLEAVGLEAFTQAWIMNPTTALIAVAFVGFPFVGGFEVLIYYAGLSGIPESVNEAAKLEGCTGIRKFFLIDVPMVMSQLKLVMILSIITGVQSFENVFIITRGGPGFTTTVPGLWMYYNAFSFQRMGYACAMGVCLFVIIFGLTVLNIRYFKSTEALEGK
jgi:raffinose/stachyose/melibiose transport system permease protein